MSGWGFKNKHQEQTIPTKFYDAKFSDYNILNEDEALKLVIEKALNGGWKFFGFWNYPFDMQFEIFGGDITVFYNYSGTIERNELSYFNLDDLVTDKDFMQAYYGFSLNSKIIEVNSEGQEEIITVIHPHQQSYSFQMKEIKTFPDKLKWLFANTTRYFGSSY